MKKRRRRRSRKKKKEEGKKEGEWEKEREGVQRKRKREWHVLKVGGVVGRCEIIKKCEKKYYLNKRECRIDKLMECFAKVMV